MKRQVFNPYLPSWEYIPDVEPRVWGNRVYIYGSHDRFNAPMFCMNDYVCWSAATEDLSDWRYAIHRQESFSFLDMSATRTESYGEERTETSFPLIRACWSMTTEKYGFIQAFTSIFRRL